MFLDCARHGRQEELNYIFKRALAMNSEDYYSYEFTENVHLTNGWQFLQFRLASWLAASSSAPEVDESNSRRHSTQNSTHCHTYHSYHPADNYQGLPISILIRRTSVRKRLENAWSRQRLNILLFFSISKEEGHFHILHKPTHTQQPHSRGLSCEVIYNKVCFKDDERTLFKSILQG